MNIQNHNYLSLTRNKELIDKDFNQQLQPTTAYRYNTPINFSKFEYLVLKPLTVLSKIHVINLYYYFRQI